MATIDLTLTGDTRTDLERCIIGVQYVKNLCFELRERMKNENNPNTIEEFIHLMTLCGSMGHANTDAEHMLWYIQNKYK